MIGSDAEALAMALVQLGDVFAWVGEYRAALEADVEAIRLLPERDKNARARATFHIAMLRRLHGQRGSAENAGGGCPARGGHRGLSHVGWRERTWRTSRSPMIGSIMPSSHRGCHRRPARLEPGGNCSPAAAQPVRASATARRPASGGGRPRSHNVRSFARGKAVGRPRARLIAGRAVSSIWPSAALASRRSCRAITSRWARGSQCRVDGGVQEAIRKPVGSSPAA